MISVNVSAECINMQSYSFLVKNKIVGRDCCANLWHESHLSDNFMV